MALVVVVLVTVLGVLPTSYMTDSLENGCCVSETHIESQACPVVRNSSHVRQMEFMRRKIVPYPGPLDTPLDQGSSIPAGNDPSP